MLSLHACYESQISQTPSFCPPTHLQTPFSSMTLPLEPPTHYLTVISMSVPSHFEANMDVLTVHVTVISFEYSQTFGKKSQRLGWVKILQ